MPGGETMAAAAPRAEGGREWLIRAPEWSRRDRDESRFTSAPGRLAVGHLKEFAADVADETLRPTSKSVSSPYREALHPS
jgi:hypothetical protein